MSIHTESFTTHMPADVTVTVRKFDADDYTNARKYWFANNAVMSMVASVFSIYIPRGEKFFIKSVRYFEDKIEDPNLQQNVKDFIKQEANHYRAHEDFNVSLEDKGVNVQKEVDTAERMFSLMEKWLPKKTQLGITVFAEHLTATGAKQMLKNPQVAEYQDPEVRKLWEWHAVEEIEHKSVAYDVYEAMGCGYLHRMWSVFIGLVFQFPFVCASMKRVLQKEGETISIRKQAKEARQLMMKLHPDRKELMKEFRMYFKPGFHPWLIDDRPFLESWYQKQKS